MASNLESEKVKKKLKDASKSLASQENTINAGKNTLKAMIDSAYNDHKAELERKLEGHTSQQLEKLSTQKEKVESL